MFDLTSSKLIILGIVALIVVGPKDLPILLRTLGKYMGMIKRQAAEFRAQFDEAIRDSELQQLKKDVESLGQETEKAMREGEQSFQSEIASAKSDVEQAIGDAPAPAPAEPAPYDTATHDANGVPFPAPTPETVRTPAEIAAADAAPRSGA